MARITSPDKILFPDAGITKAELVGYYESVADLMLRHAAGRPLTLQRFPKGIAQKGFMQKNASDHFPSSIERVTIPKADGGITVYPVLQQAEDIPYLANLNTITFHTWTSRIPDLELVDRIIFDLDPPEGAIDEVRAATEVVGDRLRELGITTALMTTGSKGYHIVAPIVGLDAELASRFAWSLARLLAADHPDLLTDEFRIDKRQRRVFVDWMRNHPGATGVVPWSLRPRPNAPVAVPIAWNELPETGPQRWTLRTVGERVAAPDEIDSLATTPQRIDAIAAAVVAEATERGFDTSRFDRFRA